MSVLTLVRHAQASVFTDDYDRLSPTGAAQARQLGDFWASRGEVFDEVYVGPRRRQRQTAELAGNQYRLSGRPWSEPIMLEELDEYDIAGLLDRLAPALAEQDRAFAVLVEGLRRTGLSAGEPGRTWHFQRMFEALLTHWQTTTDVVEAVEGWLAFRDRVRRGLDRITSRPGRGRRVAAFTSGGFIGTAVGLALAAPDRAALELSWRLRNAALTRLVFTSGRLTLDEFNTVAHLPDPALWTYR